MLSFLDRFHRFAKQLESRHDGRTTLKIADEYDVQDLLHALLYLEFDNICEEEPTPSFAGRSERMDLILKNEKIVLEAKMTRDRLGRKEIGDQLILDIAHYQQHNDCETLVCFVYDPERRIPNRTGLIQDLEGKSTERLKVVVRVAPAM
jgi:hypothetical protein